MISKENFIEYINQLKELNGASCELTEALGKFSFDNQVYFDKYEDLIVNLLQEIFQDKENDWIGYCLYEMNWFDDCKDGLVTEADGETIIPLANAGDLYDLLIGNIKDKDRGNINVGV